MRPFILPLVLCFQFLVSAPLHFNSFSAHFKQVVLGTTPSPINPTYEGQILAKAPFFAKWNYTKPSPKEVYMQDKQVIIYEPRLLQATYTKLDKALDFFAILKKAKLQKDGRYKAKINHTIYYLTLKDGLPFKLNFTDKMQSHVEITFSGVRANIALEPALFQFTPPAGIDIIHQ
ncbi:LolA-like outer membrane lipoprotein chaperone [Helicobacter ailurogastricus]|uniref:Outer membrane lipoprotein carrier protein LolA n=1 Tax=Helicobacter ailurogastricus TaxID=1578720 RepID=A0A0K2XF37_9HELI|nr:LolA-like outer membrane lipoprotein chaperone [Helicobacter ailurogastricus]CRF40607.1 Outer membrane lipoprotein carrier protein LolA [Helicobacter ailurogastricus]CRF42261.1 Outer membrane lipoprotein carrier protein LolA [Helicobacter ailurogastricus]CRF44213.1 Outer membrane lipoprotein carrier protein LolA [Helicobacter ailurogastricus]